MQLQDVFNKLTLEKQALACSFPDKKAYDSLRVSLIRKYTAFAEQCSMAGIDTYEDLFISAVWDDKEFVATFELKKKEESKRVRKDYLIKVL
jgi:hypothetical protein